MSAAEAVFYRWLPLIQIYFGRENCKTSISPDTFVGFGLRTQESSYIYLISLTNEGLFILTFSKNKSLKNTFSICTEKVMCLVCTLTWLIHGRISSGRDQKVSIVGYYYLLL